MRHRGLLYQSVVGAAMLFGVGTVADAGDDKRLVDHTRPVSEITRTGFTVQYFTDRPTPSRVQVRAGRLPVAAKRGLAGIEEDPWEGADVRVFEGASGEHTYHRVRVDGLEPGERYYYRIYAPHEARTRHDTDWGGDEDWRREFSVSTLAPEGYRTVVRYPVKVLLMTNVINAESAGDFAGVPEPEPLSEEQFEIVRREFDAAALFFWVNSHMRYWVDFEIYVDDRWQRWGPEVEDAPEFYRGWPQCRSYDGVDYRFPGGGGFTIVDTDDLETVHRGPIVEEDPYPGQVEVAFPRRWNADREEWEFYTSGGGTLGLGSIPAGYPGRSQFLGGYDTAWLAAHEFHHQMESLGEFSLSFREDERIVFNHWSPRSPSRAPDAASGPEGLSQPHPWTTSGRHGEHWDGMAFWDRTVTEAQWLRLMLGETVVVRDADGDGFPDDDPRLPLDERRFGSDPSNPKTDGHMNDLDKVMLSTWAPDPLQRSFNKPEQVFLRPNPTEADTSGSGRIDAEDPNPLVPFEPFVWPFQANVDGDPDEWADIPLTGELDTGTLRVTYRHGHTEDAYYGLIVMEGECARVRVLLDGEGKGMYSGEGVQAFEVLAGDPPRLRDTHVGTAGLNWASSVTEDGRRVVEFEIRNWAENGWFWRRGGREVGISIDAYDHRGRAWSMYEPYRPFYTRMIERWGAPPMPPNPPAELAASEADGVVFPGDERIRFQGSGWRLDGDVLRHSGGAESAAYLAGFEAVDFDLWARVEGRQDIILGGFTQGRRTMGALHDYVTFIGGYGNTRSRMRLFGSETGDSGEMVTPGEHTIQLSRRDGYVWVLWNGKPILWGNDPRARAVVDRLAVLGGYNGEQTLHEIRYRIVSTPDSTSAGQPAPEESR